MIRIEKTIEAERLIWVNKARARKSSRFALTMLHVEQDPEDPSRLYVVAADGYRLHYCHIEASCIPDLKTGEYEVIRDTKTMLWLEKIEEPVQYLDWRRPVPLQKVAIEVDADQLMLSCAVREIYSFMSGKPEHEGKIWNLDFLTDIFRAYQSAKVTVPAGNSPLRIDYEDGCTGIVMPID